MIPANVTVRNHVVVAADGTFYQSFRRDKGKVLLGARGYNSAQGNWATASTMGADPRARSLVQSGRLTPTTSITGLNGSWPYTSPLRSEEEGSPTWFLTQSLILPYNLSRGIMPISSFRERRGPGGTTIITGRVAAGMDPETDFCDVRDLRIVVDGSNRITESSWNQRCRNVTHRHVAKVSYGTNFPKMAIDPQTPQDVLIAQN